MVTLQNYEEYMLLYVDDELDAASEKELMLFLEEHPALKKELELFQKTKLPPAGDLVFSGKDQLLKQPAKKIPLNKWLLVAVAASVVLLIALVTGKWMNEPVSTTTELPVAVKNDDSITSAPQAVVKNVVPAQDAAPAAQPVEKKSPSAWAAAPKPPVKKKTVTPEVNPPLPPPAPKTPIHYEKEEPKIVKLKEAPVDQLGEPVSETPQPSASPEQKKKKRGLLALLPISHEKKEGFHHLKNTMEQKVETVKNIQEELKNTSLEVKLGNKELFVINL